jgi:hypothetical protein
LYLLEIVSRTIKLKDLLDMNDLASHVKFYCKDDLYDEATTTTTETETSTTTATTTTTTTTTTTSPTTTTTAPKTSTKTTQTSSNLASTQITPTKIIIYLVKHEYGLYDIEDKDLLRIFCKFLNITFNKNGIIFKVFLESTSLGIHDKYINVTFEFVNRPPKYLVNNMLNKRIEDLKETQLAFYNIVIYQEYAIDEKISMPSTCYLRINAKSELEENTKKFDQELGKLGAILAIYKTN